MEVRLWHRCVTWQGWGLQKVIYFHILLFCVYTLKNVSERRKERGEDGAEKITKILNEKTVLCKIILYLVCTSPEFELYIECFV